MQNFTLKTFVCAAALFFVCVNSLSHLSSDDKRIFKEKLLSNLRANEFSDPRNAYYSLLGLSLIGAEFVNAENACKMAKKFVADSTATAKHIHYSLAAANLLKNCQIDGASAETKKRLEKALDTAQSAEDVFHAFSSMKYSKVKVSEKSLLEKIDAILKKDSSPAAQAHVFHTVTAMNLKKEQLKKYFDDIEDVLAQADELDSKYLFYESGLHTTAFVVHGIYSLMGAYGAAPAKLTEQSVSKLAAYLLSRRQTPQLEHAVQVFAALHAMSASDARHLPVSVVPMDPASVSAAAPRLRVRLATVWGHPLAGFDVRADQVKQEVRQSGAATFISNQAFTGVTGDDAGLYELDIIKAANSKIPRQFYRVIMKLAPPASTPAGKYILLAGHEFRLKVMGRVEVNDARIQVRDQQQQQDKSNWRTLHLGQQLEQQLRVDARLHERLELQFALSAAASSGASGATATLHQVFARLVSEANSNEEILFVVEPDTTKSSYKFVLDLETRAKDFDYKSGVYRLELILGDALIENPVVWPVANLHLQMPSQVGSAAAQKPNADGNAGTQRTVAGSKKSAVSPRIGQGPSRAKPTINHVFRPADKRADNKVAMLFTGICVAVPGLILLVLWQSLGVNISNFPIVSSPLSAIGFHIGLGAILALFYVYWTSLNMFQTLMWLGVISVPTFLCGNYLLRHIASQRQKS